MAHPHTHVMKNTRRTSLLQHARRISKTHDSRHRRPNKNDHIARQLNAASIEAVEEGRKRGYGPVSPVNRRDLDEKSGSCSGCPAEGLRDDEQPGKRSSARCCNRVRHHSRHRRPRAAVSFIAVGAAFLKNFAWFRNLLLVPFPERAPR
jgi:hypothetical protein